MLWKCSLIFCFKKIRLVLETGGRCLWSCWKEIKLWSQTRRLRAMVLTLDLDVFSLLCDSAGSGDASQEEHHPVRLLLGPVPRHHLHPAPEETRLLLHLQPAHPLHDDLLPRPAGLLPAGRLGREGVAGCHRAARPHRLPAAGGWEHAAVRERPADRSPSPSHTHSFTFPTAVLHWVQDYFFKDYFHCRLTLWNRPFFWWCFNSFLEFFQFSVFFPRLLSVLFFTFCFSFICDFFFICDYYQWSNEKFLQKCKIKKKKWFQRV